MSISRAPAHRGRLAPLITVALAAAFAVGACGAAATPAPAEDYKLHMRMTPSNVAWVVAQEEGLFEGIDLDWELVGYGESAQLFVAGTDPVGQESPWEAAVFQSQGEDIVYFGTPAALTFYNGIVIRTADAGKYKSLTDLKGKKFGIPGFGTGSYQAFEILAKTLSDMDTKADLQLVEADPGALVGLLETGEIEGMINFTGQTALAVTKPETFTLLVNFNTEFFKKTGANLVINGPMARRAWLDENRDVADRLIEGVDKGIQWLKDNPDTLKKGGKYAHITEGEGWYQTPETEAFLIDLFLKGEYYYTADMFTQAWVDAVYGFIQSGEGVLAETIPPIEQIFYLPMLR